MLPIINTAADTYNGASVSVTHITVTDTEATLRMKDGKITDTKYSAEIIARSNSAKTVTISIGNKSMDYSLTSAYATISKDFGQVISENNPCLEIIFPKGEYWIYALNLSTSGSIEDISKRLTSAEDNIDNISNEVDELKEKADAAYQKAYNAMPKYGVCETASGTVAKTVTGIEDFVLTPGMRVAVMMSNTNTSNNPTLNINSTGAKPIVTSDGTRLTTSNNANRSWTANSLVTFVYDGTNWRIDDSVSLTKIDHILTDDLVGTSGWINLKEGKFNYGSGKLVWDGSKLSVKGTVEAYDGKIGGWTLSSTLISHKTEIDDEPYIVYMNAPTNPTAASNAFTVRSGVSGSYSYPFAVKYDGTLIATKAKITGEIVATSLTLGSGASVSANKVSGLSSVATSGKYSDLSGTPNLTVYIAKDGTVGSTPAEGATGFKVSSAGLLTASNAVIYGTIYASVGEIGGFTIGSSKLYNGLSTLSGTANGVYVGTDGIALGGGKFKVTSAGAITATSGKIGGFTIGSTLMYKEGTLNDTPYRFYIQAPDTPTATNGAISLRTGVTGSYSYPFIVHYDGSLIATKAAIKGEITATSGSITNMTINACTVAGTLSGTDVVIKNTDTASNTSGFRVVNNSGTTVFRVNTNVPASLGSTTYGTSVSNNLYANYIHSPSISADALATKSLSVLSVVQGSTVPTTYGSISSAGVAAGAKASVWDTNAGGLMSTAGYISLRATSGTSPGIYITAYGSSTTTYDVGFYYNGSALVATKAINAPTVNITDTTAFKKSLGLNNVVTDIKFGSSTLSNSGSVTIQASDLGFSAPGLATTIAEKTLSSGTSYTNLGSFTLDAGYWIVIVTCGFQSNASGRRVINISSTSGGSSLNNTAIDTRNGVSGSTTFCRIVMFIHATASTKYYVNAYQNSGSSLTANGRYGMFRISS